MFSRLCCLESSDSLNRQLGIAVLIVVPVRQRHSNGELGIGRREEKYRQGLADRRIVCRGSKHISSVFIPKTSKSARVTIIN